MKGLVFTELLAMAESSVGERRVDRIIDQCPLASGGAYCGVSNYDSSELMTLISALSKEVRVDPDILQYQFGRWLLKSFTVSHPELFKIKANTFNLLESVESEIHAEVRKLYPDAELPEFETFRSDPQTLEFIYQSPRGLVTFCRGLIEACLDHYGERAEISYASRTEGEVHIARFLLRLQPVTAGQHE